jgi:hypothetical protein
MFDIRMLGQDECIDNWEDIRQHLDKALVHSQGEWTANDILKRVLSDANHFHVWEVVNDKGVRVALASTRIVNYNHYDILRIFTLANVGESKWGDYQEEALTKLAEKARDGGLKRIEFIGRKGWEKQLKGWDFLHITMGLEL